MRQVRGNPHPLLVTCCILTSLGSSLAYGAEALPGLTDAQTAALRQAAGNVTESEYVFARVDLYYMTDVTRLMQMLAHVQTPSRWGGEAYDEAKAKAATARKDLSYAETALAKALAAENDCKSRQARMPEDLKAARTQRDAAKTQLDAATKAKDDLQARFNAAPENSDERARLKTELDAAVKVEAERKTKYDQAQARVEDLEAQEAALPGKLTKAQETTKKAQELSGTCGKAVVVAAQVELEALAALRAAPPLVFTTPRAGATNPCQRLYMYAYCDRNTLFLYGPRECVDQARVRIAQLDRPGAQAKLTLWTLELSTGGRAALKLNNAVAMVDRELAYTRSCNAAAVAVLRQCIQEEVAKATHGVPQYGGPDPDRLRRYHFYSPPVCRAMGFTPRTTDSTGDDADGESAWLTQWTLPDPMAITTLGEALMVLSLANNSSRAAVITDFNGRLARQVEQIARAENAASRSAQFPKKNVSCSFVRLYSTLVGDKAEAWAAEVNSARETNASAARQQLQAALNTDELTPAQLEIVRALQRVALGNMTRYVRGVLPTLGSLPDADRERMIAKLTPLTQWMWTQFGILTPQAAPTDARSIAATVTSQLSTALGQLEQRFPATVLNARVAAANQMLKEMVCAFDEDLDCHFVRPMLDRLRLDLRKRDIRVGIIQRTSVLGANRQYSHVGATSTAQLALGETIDILGEVQEAIKIYTAVQTAGVWQALAGLKNLPTDRPPELYGITTRGAFEVTPIVDPSGQALRFRLRHVQANEVREPDGTVNPKMPRIERHTVDTEVQLTSTEIREISRYSANEALGLPTVKTGGLPILKHIPLLKSLPLIGWFTLRTGKDASIQESLILGQTTVYPTIQEMMDLLLMGCPTEPSTGGAKEEKTAG
ncbi:MAG: hypothetical protein KKI08_01570 [Armatimonadetes bacterium]|nr:hypothetical protein [Armatimonadota bacterium]